MAKFAKYSSKELNLLDIVIKYVNSSLYLMFLLERASRDDRARDPRTWKRLRIKARKGTRCVTSEFQLGFSQLEPWYIYSSLTNDYRDHVTRSIE